MADLVYLSERKIRDELDRLGKAPRQRSTGLELAAVPKLTIAEAPLTPGADDLPQRFQRALAYVEKEARAFTDPAIELAEWITFDLPMGYALGGRDGRTPPVQDVALFAGAVPGIAVGQERPIKLLLSGDARHLLMGGCKPLSPDDPVGVGWMGSGTTWLYHLVQTIEDFTDRGIDELPSFLRDPAIHLRRGNDPEQVAQWVYRYVARSHPAGQEERLRGYARVLLKTERDWPERLVLATPLYIEHSRPRPARWLIPLRRSRRFRHQTA
ncbi:MULTISPECIES: SAVMC3_10250 family protein [unclassified Kitasatospora]|uniref:SAVMC3_10250 family protein n=1 Tax=unclassified Kitasatospora TaxID=2633591 RepID=UPI0033DF1DDE